MLHICSMLLFEEAPSQDCERQLLHLYWKPKDVTPMCDEVPWFTVQVLGRNTLGSMVKKMLEQIGVEGKTNHSLCATGAESVTDIIYIR